LHGGKNGGKKDPPLETKKERKKARQEHKSQGTKPSQVIPLEEGDFKAF